MKPLIDLLLSRGFVEWTAFHDTNRSRLFDNERFGMIEVSPDGWSGTGYFGNNAPRGRDIESLSDYLESN